MAYRVTAPYVVLKYHDESGQLAIRGFYQHAIVPATVDEDNLKHHLDNGMVEEIEEAEPEVEAPIDPIDPNATGDQGGAGDSGVSEPPKTPSKAASKADWVIFVVEYKGLTQAEAEAFTRDELAASYGDA